jgi:hypothetical protein
MIELKSGKSLPVNLGTFTSNKALNTIKSSYVPSISNFNLPEAVIIAFRPLIPKS